MEIFLFGRIIRPIENIQIHQILKIDLQSIQKHQYLKMVSSYVYHLRFIDLFVKCCISETDILMYNLRTTYL